MKRCVLIGIGGTGAKCVEAYTHLAAAGMGPENVCVGLVDQDKSNGNLTRTRELIDACIKLRAVLRGDNHHLGTSSLFGPRLELIEDIWAPESRSQRRFADTFGTLDDEEEDLLSMLFNSEEQDMILDEGFRGHPAVGAAAIEAKLAQPKPGAFWDRIKAEISKAETGDDVAIFVVGSIFGGTGASGFPTISRELRRRANSNDKQLKVHIGGALLLPYFQIAAPPSASTEQPIVPATQFLKQTQGALKYYRHLMSGENVWDKLYVLGWSPLLELPTEAYSAGGDAQANPPLLPEIYAALAAQDFLRGASAGIKPIVRIDRKEPGAIAWHDFPSGSDLRERVGQLLRFALTFRAVYGPIIGNPQTPFSRQCWHKQLITPCLDSIGDHARDELVQQIIDYCTKFLQWIATTIFRSEASMPEEHRGNLIRARTFALENEGNDSLAVLKNGLDVAAIDGFSRLVVPSGGPELDSIFRRLSHASAKSKLASGQGIPEKGIGVFCARLHEMCG